MELNVQVSIKIIDGLSSKIYTSLAMRAAVSEEAYDMDTYGVGIGWHHATQGSL